MVDISTVISQGLLIDDNFPCAWSNKDLSLTAFPFGVPVKFIWDFLRLFNLLQSFLSLLQRKEFEFYFRVDHFISEIVFINFLTVFGKYSEVIKIGVSVEVKRHLIEAELQDSRGRQFG